MNPVEPVRTGQYVQILSSPKSRWTQVKGEPKGVEEIVLRRHKDGSYTHLLRIQKGVEISEPVVHEFHEEVLYLEGVMLNTKTKEKITGGTYVYHEPGEPHGPFRCLRTCLLFEFRYYKTA
jgi:hypothetical protein